ncbi:MAG: glucosamine-6-phosphate deaminase [Trueperaceae bacterium]|nr:glucosamine-6-phosphate deaminase [Trueperaceae bacterium]
MDLGTPTIRRFGDLRVEIHHDAHAAGRAAAVTAAAALRDAIARSGRARAIFATGTSQLAFFAALREVRDVAWGKVEAFHMDEYLGLDQEHPASFRTFLRRELVGPLGIGLFHGIDGDPDRAEETIAAYTARLREAPIDLCCMGIGENGHLAFNDPPLARFDDPESARVVRLDQVSRRQQVGEGHFGELADVPTHAITLTIPTLLDAGRVNVVAPETRKAEAVRAALEGPVDPGCPASILRRASNATAYLDRDAASRLAPG